MDLSLLILEDDQQVARSLERALKAQGYQVEVAFNAAQALEIARTRPLDLILCDVRMPGVDGLEALASLRTLQEGLRSIVMTGYASEDAPIRAIQNRVDDYLLKPVKLDRLLASVRHSAELCRLEKQGRRALEELRSRYLKLVSSVIGVFWEQDRWYWEHSKRVAALAVDLGVELGLSSAQLDQLELAAWLHDLGLALIERELLRQQRTLTPEERRRLEQHPQRLREILEDLPDLSELQPILVNLRERFDGSGYPRALKGQEIPLEARILAVAEAWDSMHHPRPHRPALSPEQIREELKSFDPTVVSVCQGLSQEPRDPRRQQEAAHTRWRTLLRLGSVLAQARDWQPARQALMEAGELCRQLHGEDNLEVLAELAALEAAQNRPDEALRWLARLRPALEHAPAGIYDRAARSYLLLGRAPMARELIERGLEVARAHRDVPALGSLLGLKMSLVPEAEWRACWEEWSHLHRLEPLTPQEAEAVKRSQALGLIPKTEEAAAAGLEVLTFGPPETRPPVEWDSRKALEMFFYLVVQRRPVPGDKLAEALWPDKGEVSRKNLNTTASRVRRSLRGHQNVVWERNFFSLDPSLPARIDLHEFDRLLEQVRPDPAGRLSPESRQAGEQAAALYRGDLLEGQWWEWAFELRRTYRERAFNLLFLLAGDQEAQRNWMAAQQHYARMLEMDPCREEAQLGQMRCLAGQGLRDTAVRRYNDYCRILQRELGLSPGPEAVRLYQQLL